jgi:glycosyltransferase involved in cell wall biosynthesis
MPKIKIVYINKYFFPMQRHSGILNFAHDLCNNLAETFDLKVISWKYSDDVKSIENFTNYSVRRVKVPFRIRSAFLAKHLKPDLIILGSGIKYPEILLFVVLFIKSVFFSKPIIVYQHSVPKFPKISLASFFNKICAGFWFSNPFNKEKIIKKIYKRAVYVPVGIDSQRLETTSAKKEKDVRIGYFGHLNEAKGVDILVRAFLKLDTKNCELIIAGTGSLVQKIKELTEGKKNISIYGFCNNVVSYIKSCDFLVFPYRNAVSVLGLSLSCLEAMALGKPIIASNNIALTPLVKHNYNGFIFNNDDEIARYLNLLIKNEEKRKIMGKKSMEIASEYSINKVTKQISKIIEEIINERRN